MQNSISDLHMVHQMGDHKVENEKHIVTPRKNIVRIVVSASEASCKLGAKWNQEQRRRVENRIAPRR